MHHPYQTWKNIERIRLEGRVLAAQKFLLQSWQVVSKNRTVKLSRSPLYFFGGHLGYY